MGEWWKDPKFREAAKKILIAILLAVLSLLGYDQAVVQPGLSAAKAGLERVEERVESDLDLSEPRAGGGTPLSTLATDSHLSRSLTVGAFYRADEQTAIPVTQDGTVNPAGTNTQVTATSNVSTSEITIKDAGTVLWVHNVATYTVTFSDTGTLKLGGNRALGQYDTLGLLSDGTNWLELSHVNN